MRRLGRRCVAGLLAVSVFGWALVTIAEGAAGPVQGEITKVAGPTITVAGKDYDVAGAKITVNGSDGKIDDLKVGMTVTLVLDKDKVTTVEAKSAAGDNKKNDKKDGKKKKQ